MKHQNMHYKALKCKMYYHHSPIGLQPKGKGERNRLVSWLNNNKD